MAGYPVVLNVCGRRCLVVGGGLVAWRKGQGLLLCGACVRIVAPSVVPELEEQAEKGQVEIIRRPFESEDLGDMFLVISATGDEVVNRRVAREAGARGILVNVVDQPDLCSFTVPAVLRRGDLTLAISTDGKSPAFARKIRDRLAGEFGPEYGPYVDFLGRMRDWFNEQFPDDGEKRLLAGRKLVELDLIDYFVEGQPALAMEEAKQCILSLLA